MQAKTEGFSSFVVLTIIFGMFVDAKLIFYKRDSLQIEKKCPEKVEFPCNFILKTATIEDIISTETSPVFN